MNDEMTDSERIKNLQRRVVLIQISQMIVAGIAILSFIGILNIHDLRKKGGW